MSTSASIVINERATLAGILLSDQKFSPQTRTKRFEEIDKALDEVVGVVGKINGYRQKLAKEDNSLLGKHDEQAQVIYKALYTKLTQELSENLIGTLTTLDSSDSTGKIASELGAYRQLLNALNKNNGDFGQSSKERQLGDLPKTVPAIVAHLKAVKKLFISAQEAGFDFVDQLMAPVFLATEQLKALEKFSKAAVLNRAEIKDKYVAFHTGDKRINSIWAQVIAITETKDRPQQQPYCIKFPRDALDELRRTVKKEVIEARFHDLTKVSRILSCALGFDTTEVSEEGPIIRAFVKFKSKLKHRLFRDEETDSRELDRLRVAGEEDPIGSAWDALHILTDGDIADLIGRGRADDILLTYFQANYFDMNEYRASAILGRQKHIGALIEKILDEAFSTKRGMEGTIRTNTMPLPFGVYDYLGLRILVSEKGDVERLYNFLTRLSDRDDQVFENIEVEKKIIEAMNKLLPEKIRIPVNDKTTKIIPLSLKPYHIQPKGEQGEGYSSPHVFISWNNMVFEIQICTFNNAQSNEMLNTATSHHVAHKATAVNSRNSLNDKQKDLRDGMFEILEFLFVGKDNEPPKGNEYIKLELT